MQFVTHLIKQATLVRTRANPPKTTPTITALITLVAARVVTSKITALKTVRRTPISTSGIAGQRQFFLVPLKVIEVKSRRARKTSATPKATHKNAVVTVIVAI